MASTILGRVGLVLKGEWAETTAYKALDVVSHNGYAWAAKIDSTGVEPSTTNSTEWQPLAESATVLAQMESYTQQAASSAEAGTKALANQAPVFSDSTAYSVGSIVTHDGDLYAFTSDHAAGAWTGTDATKITVGNEVSNLKSAINLIEITNQTSGLTVDSQQYVNRNTGEIERNTSKYPNAVSGIQVEGNAFVFKIESCEAAGMRGIAFYDENGDFIPNSGKGYTVGKTTYFFTIPAGAVTMAVTTFGVDNVFSIRFVYFQNTDKTLTESDAPADGKATGDAISAVSAAKLDSSVFTEFYNDEAFIYRGYLAQGTDLNTLGENGRYSFAGGSRDTLINKPETVTSGTGVLFVFKGTGSGSKLSTQLLINDTASNRIIYERVINNTNNTTYYDWKQIIYPIANETGTSETELMTQKAITDAIASASHQSSVWRNKTIVCFGDSRTWYDGKAYNDRTKAEWTGKTCVGYQQQLRDALGCTVISEGVSGNTSVQICERILAYDYTGVDAVFLEGGVNDFVKASSVTIGEIQPIGSTFDTTTVYGAWQSAIEYILTNYPSVLIYMDIPAIAWTSAGLFPYSVAKIKGEIAELYHLPCLDLYKNAGINEVNRDYWYCDDVELTNWRLHFNDYGNVLIGQKIAGFLSAH